MEFVLLSCVLVLGLGGLWMGWLYCCEYNKRR